MSDPVADKFGFLKAYVSSPDTLVAYAKWYGKVAEPITSAEMTTIDSKSMTLTCKMKAGGNKQVCIAFDPPLSGHDDVKPRLLEMEAIAQKNLGMIKTPTITSFRLPPGYDCYISGTLGTIYLYFVLSPNNSTSPIFTVANVVRDYLGSALFKNLSYGIAGIHVLEAAYAFALCRRYKTGFSVGAAYGLAALCLGLPVCMDIHRRLRPARIDSVKKVE